MRKGTFLELDVELQDKLKKQYPRKDTTQESQNIYGCSLVDFYKMANEFAAEWKQTMADVDFDHNIDSGYYGNSDHSRAFFTLEAPETDAQYHERLMQMLEATIYQEEHDRKEFERLQAKFKK